jgi:hypothetical protein
MKTIEVIVNTDGTLKIDAIGFSGPDCQKATSFLEKALGKTTGKQKKPEHYRQVKKLQQVGT